MSEMRSKDEVYFSILQQWAITSITQNSLIFVLNYQKMHCPKLTMLTMKLGDATVDSEGAILFIVNI